MVAAAMPVAGAAGKAVGIFWLVVFFSWVLLFAIMIGLLVAVTLLRRWHQRGRERRRGAAVLADPQLPARLAEIRRTDPDFDGELLLEAAQIACLLMFAAMSTGDEEPIRRLTASSFWSTVYGRYIALTARDARQRRRAKEDGAPTPASQPRLPVDYQTSAPELVGLELGRQQLARVRVSFSQLGAVLGPGAAGQAAMASATSLRSLGAGFGGSMSSRMDGARSGVSWVSWAGGYELDFIRPADSRTAPDAALAGRTCSVCGAAYRSEFATVCDHCRSPRPVAWGSWLLTQIMLVQG